MDLIEFREYSLSFEGVEEKTPFGKFARRYDSILVFYVVGHMFCFVDMDDFSYVNVRSLPEKIGELNEKYLSVEKPLNRSLKYWIQLNFNGDIPDSEVYQLVEDAYNIVKAKYEKKKPSEKNN